MKRLLILPLFVAGSALSACGLRGDLERPDPMWGDPPPVEETTGEDNESSAALRPRTQMAENSYRDPNTGEIVWVENENGGDKPLAAPVKPIEDDGGLPPLAE